MAKDTPELLLRIIYNANTPSLSNSMKARIEACLNLPNPDTVQEQYDILVSKLINQLMYTREHIDNLRGIADNYRKFGRPYYVTGRSEFTDLYYRLEGVSPIRFGSYKDIVSIQATLPNEETINVEGDIKLIMKAVRHMSKVYKAYAKFLDKQLTILQRDYDIIYKGPEVPGTNKEDTLRKVCDLISKTKLHYPCM